MNRNPDFYLTCAGEYAPLAEPRACWVKQSLRDARDNVHLYVEMQPSFCSTIAPKHHVSSVVLSERTKGSFFGELSFPAHIYVSEIPSLNALYCVPFEPRALKLIAWGRLFRTIEEAEREAYEHARAVQSARAPEVFHARDVHFIGEQDGKPETILKNRLISELFATDSSVLRAYLARVDLGTGVITVALCLKTATGPEDELIQGAFKIFSSIFQRRAFLDILFVTEEQERDLSRVCKPFYAVSEH